MIIKQITVIDPENLSSEKRDLYIADGVFAGFAESKGKKNLLDGSGLFAAPGFMDLHTHCGMRLIPSPGIVPDRMGVRQGVTTVVDAGSVGINNFTMFKKEVLRRNRTRVLFFINIARNGLLTGAELKDMNKLMTAEEFANFRKENSENLAGIKVRMSRSALGDSGIAPLVYAKEIALKADLPLMVHIGNGPPTLSEVLDVLDKGDIVTHCFHGKKGGLVDSAEAFTRAVERGVNFDIGHGKESFCINTVEKALAIKDVDFSISTDLHKMCVIKPVVSLMVTMSKLLTLGYTVEDLVRRVTVLPSRSIGRACTPIEIGQPATMTVFRLAPNIREFADSEGNPVTPEKLLVPVMTFINGKCEWSSNAKF